MSPSVHREVKGFTKFRNIVFYKLGLNELFSIRQKCVGADGVLRELKWHLNNILFKSSVTFSEVLTTTNTMGVRLFFSLLSFLIKGVKLVSNLKFCELKRT